MAKVRVAIVGASGYAGEELIRLLTGHPNVELRIITSRQNSPRRTLRGSPPNATPRSSRFRTGSLPNTPSR